MANMLEAISEPRAQLSPYAPKVQMMKIEPDQIKSVIGQGGKTINEIIEQSDGVKIDIEQDGTVIIYHYDQEAINKAMALIEKIVKKAKVGEVYDGKIVRVEDNYAFVNLFDGEIIKVKVTKVDEKGKVNVSRKALLPKPVKKEESKAE